MHTVNQQFSEEIRSLVERYHPRVLSQKLKSRHSDLYNKVIELTQDLASDASFEERIYRCMNPQESLVCRYSYSKKFLNIEDGYGFCGNLRNCQCHRGHLGSFQTTRDFEKMKESQKRTWLAKHGVINPMHLPEVVNRVMSQRRTPDPSLRRMKDLHRVLERLDGTVRPKFEVSSYEGVTDQHREWECGGCGNVFHDHVDNGRTPRCRRCFPITSSQGEQNLANWVEQQGVTVMRNYRDQDAGREIDIFLPDLSLGIEFNGVNWHSDKWRPKHYHLEKTRAFEDRGIQLIHVWSDDWEQRREIVKSRLQAKMGRSPKLWARRCNVRPIDNGLYRDFCNASHLRGWAPAKVRLGLFHQDRLVAVMSFSRGRYFRDSWEMIRYCSVGTVVGGAGELFSWFLKNHSSADLDWGSGDVYRELGFDMETDTGPSLWFFKNGQRRHRSSVQRKHLIQQGADPGLTGIEMARKLGYLVIYGCGNRRYRYRRFSSP